MLSVFCSMSRHLSAHPLAIWIHLSLLLPKSASAWQLAMHWPLEEWALPLPLLAAKPNNHTNHTDASGPSPFPLMCPAILATLVQPLDHWLHCSHPQPQSPFDQTTADSQHAMHPTRTLYNDLKEIFIFTFTGVKWKWYRNENIRWYEKSFK